MAKIKNKNELCRSELKNFKAIQAISGYSLFDRYNELEHIVSRKIDEEYRHFLAKPVKTGESVSWYSASWIETPRILTELDSSTRAKYEQIVNKTLSHYHSAVSALKAGGADDQSAADYLEKALKFVDGNFVYCYDNKTVLGVWGMKLRDDVREDSRVLDLSGVPIIITFNQGQGGIISAKSILYKQKDDTLTVDDIPSIEVKEGFIFTGWDTNPVNFKVVRNTEFTAQYNIIAADPPKEPVEKIAASPPTLPQPLPLTPPEEPEPPIPTPPPLPPKIEEKVEEKEEEKIEEKVEKKPKKSWWKRLLYWLLLLLLLGLIFLVIYCCLFDRCNWGICDCSRVSSRSNCNCNCNCNCNDNNNDIEHQGIKPCDTTTASGGEEGYMGSFEMGQQGGTFLFEYNTYTIPDRITIYDGGDASGNVIFRYEGGTEVVVREVVTFNESIITVVVVGLGASTGWNFVINCPDSSSQLNNSENQYISYDYHHFKHINSISSWQR